MPTCHQHGEAAGAAGGDGGEEEEEEGEGRRGGGGNKDVAEIAAKSKAAVQHLKVVLNELDAAFDKLAA